MNGLACLAPDRLREALRRRADPGAAGVPSEVDASLGRWLEALAGEVDGDALDAGVSREWSVIRFECEPGAAEAPAAALPESPDAGTGLDVDLGDDAGGAPDVDLGDVMEAVPDAPDLDLGRPVPPAPPVPVEPPDLDLGDAGAPDAWFDGPLPDGFGDEPDVPGLFAIDDDVPPGFEALAGPQLFWADVWFNGRKAGTTALTATAESIVFETPADVVALIAETSDPGALLARVSEPLPTNAHLACFGEDDPAGCGVVEAAPVAVIWDESRLRVDLFLAAGLQTLQSREAARNLAVPERRGSSILSLHASGFGSDAAESASDAIASGFDVSGRLLTGYGSGYVSTAADYGSRQEEIRLRELKLTHQAAGHEFTGGTYTWSPGGAWVDIDVLGVGFSTSFNTRLDVEQAFGSELVVFLQRRAIVQLFVDGRVRFGSTYEAGNQVIDTRALPDGTYPVEIRITESDGTTRSEFRTFTRSASIPPRGEPVFTLATGIARNGQLFPGADEPLVSGFSLANRIGDRSAWRLGMLQLDEHSFAQGGLAYLGERVTFRLDGTVGERATAALGLSIGYTGEIGALSATLDRFESDIPRALDTPFERLYPSDGTRWNVGASRTLGAYSFRASAGRRLGSEGGGAAREETRYALGVRRSLFEGRDVHGALGADVSHVGDDTVYTLRADVRFGRGSWRTRLGADASGGQGGEGGVALAAALDYAGDEGGSFDWQAGVNARVGRDESFGAGASLEHAAYRARASGETVRRDGGGTSSVAVASASAQIGLDRKGFAVGGTEAARSGVIVSVHGEPAGAPFDIVVDGRRMATGEVGAPRFIGLQPFESYDVKLVALGVSSNGIGRDVHRFTLYPGNVQRIDVRAEPRVLLIAAIVDADGAALASAVVEIDDNPQVTDVGGILQAEVVPGSRLPVRALDGRRCTLLVPDAPPGEEVLVPLEPLVCELDEGPSDRSDQ